MKKRLLIFLTLILISTQSRLLFCENPLEKPVCIAKTLLLGYLGCASYLAFHELGHAVVNTMITGEKIELHFGSTDATKKTIFETENLKIHSLNPLKGLASFEKGPESNLGKFLVYTAGGAFGAIQNYIFLSSLVAYHKYQETKNLKKSLLYGIKNGLFIFKSIKNNKNLKKHELYSQVLLVTTALILNLNRLLYSFFPGGNSIINLIPGKLSTETDGTKAWNALGADEKTCKALSFLTWFLEWALRALIIRQAYKCIKESKTS